MHVLRSCNVSLLRLARSYGFSFSLTSGLSYDGKSDWDVEDEGRSDEESDSEDGMAFDSEDGMVFDSEDGEEVYYDEDSVDTRGRAGDNGKR